MVHTLDVALAKARAEAWPRPATDDLVGRLEHLAGHLTAHFAREEEGGLLEEATAEAPRFGLEAQALLEEHVQLLARVRNLVAMGRGNCQAPAASWQEFAEGLAGTTRQLLAHEGRENALLQKAFNVDEE